MNGYFVIRSTTLPYKPTALSLVRKISIPAHLLGTLHNSQAQILRHLSISHFSSSGSQDLYLTLNPCLSSPNLNLGFQRSVKEMTELSYKHHTVIQALLSRGPLKEEEFHNLFLGVSGRHPGSHQKLFNDCLLKLNKELAYVQFELRGCRNQYDGNIYYGVVNNVADEQAKLGSQYSVPQLAFYKGIIEAIIQSEATQGSISTIEALNIRLENQIQNGAEPDSQGGPPTIPAAFKNFSISQKEKTLHELVRDRWLCTTPDGNIGLGVRSFLDLRSWFRNNDVTPCHVCNEAGVKADLCQNETCSVRVHSYCLKKKFSQKRIDKFCPGCGTEWPCPVSKRELVEEDESEQPNEPTQTQEPTQNQAPPSWPNRRKMLRNCKSEPDTDNARPSQVSSQIPESRRTTRRSSRIR